MIAPNLIGRPCPHCGAEDNTGATFRCGTQHVGMETFQSQHCRDRVFVRDLEADDEVNDIRRQRHFQPQHWGT